MITSNEPQVEPMKRYTINETAALLGIHRNTLRRYTDSGYIKCKYRKDTMTKIYLGQEVLRFWRETY